MRDCRPRTTWRPLTLAGSPVLPPCVSLEVFATPTRRYHGRTLIRPSPSLRVPPCGRGVHTRRFGTVTSPPLVSDMPWGAPSSLTTHETVRSSNNDSIMMSMQITSFVRIEFHIQDWANLRFLVSLPPDQVYPSCGFSLKIVNILEPVHVSDNSRSPSTFQFSSIFSLTSHPT